MFRDIEPKTSISAKDVLPTGHGGTMQSDAGNNSDKISITIDGVDSVNKVCSCTFLYRADKVFHSVFLDLPPFSRKAREKFEMRPTDVPYTWAVTVELPLASRFSFRMLELNEPLEERHIGAERFASKPMWASGMHIETPGVEPAYSAVLPQGTPVGEVTEYAIKAGSEQPERQVWLYEPAKESEGNIEKLLIFFDGEMYLKAVNAASIIDSLIHRQEIPRVAALFVSPLEGMREKELVLNPNFSSHTANGLREFAEEKLGKRFGEGSCVAVGASFGGIAALYMAKQHPEFIHGVIAQSPSLWRCQDRMDDLIGAANAYFLNIHWGVFETQEKNGTSLAEANRQFVEMLAAAGHSFEFEEYRGGHGAVNWREALPKALKNVLKKI